MEDEFIDIRDVTIAGTPLPQIRVRQLPIFQDTRGANIVIYEDQVYDAIPFVQDNLSVSRFNVLRGIHGDDRTWKAITCLTGEVYFVIIDLKEGSRTKGKWMAMPLSDENRYQVLVPPDHGNAHYVESAFAMFHYKLSKPYDAGSQFTISWNSSEFDIIWPCTDPILSERDS